MVVNYDLTEALAFGGDFSSLSLWRVGFGFPSSGPTPAAGAFIHVLAINIPHAIAIVTAYENLDGGSERGILSVECVDCVLLTDPRSEVDQYGYIHLIEAANE